MAAPRDIRAHADFAGNSVVSITQFDRTSIEYIMEIADLMKAIVTTAGGCQLLKNKVLANVFYEPSTRTSSSFAVAMQRLGGTVIQINESTSSAAKGETLSDSIRCLGCYCDLVVLRHPSKGAAADASRVCPVPVLNAGDGVGEHPTQALLDAYTIRAELLLPRGPAGAGNAAADSPSADSASASAASSASADHYPGGLHVTLVGDLKHGRTTHSLARLMAVWRPGTSLTYVSPPELAMPEEIVAALGAGGGVSQSHADGLSEDVVRRTDVLYVTRVQKERFADAETYERLKHAFVVTPETLAPAKARMAVMHPLPRVGEISEAVDSDPRAAYFRQMRSGLFVRMALLALAAGASREDIEGAAAAAAAAGRA